MKKRNFGVMGFPLEHSLSKSYFEQKFAKEKIENVSYESFSTEASRLLMFLIEMEKSLVGFNITFPYKRDIIPYLDSVSEIAQEVRSVNVVKIDRSSVPPKFLGYNTDILGFEQSLLEHIKPKHRSALILGTGGAARSAAYVLKKLNIDYQYVSREAKPDVLTYETLDKKTIEDNLLIINATPLGMLPDVDTCPPIDYTAIGKNHFLFDMVYNPAQTLFLKNGKKNGAKTKNGYDMLCYQAEESWKIWNEEV